MIPEKQSDHHIDWEAIHSRSLRMIGLGKVIAIIVVLNVVAIETIVSGNAIVGGIFQLFNLIIVGSFASMECPKPRGPIAQGIADVFRTNNGGIP